MITPSSFITDTTGIKSTVYSVQKTPTLSLGDFCSEHPEHSLSWTKQICAIVRVCVRQCLRSCWDQLELFFYILFAHKKQNTCAVSHIHIFLFFILGCVTGTPAPVVKEVTVWGLIFYKKIQTRGFQTESDSLIEQRVDMTWMNIIRQHTVLYV